MATKLTPERKDTPEEHHWDLSPLFQTDKDWDALFVDVDVRLETYNNFKGRLKKSPDIFKDAIGFHLDLLRQIEKLYTYAHLKSDEDKSNQFYLGMHQKAANLFTRASEMASFLTPEIQSIPDDTIIPWLEIKALQEYHFFLEKLLRHKPHTRNESEEQILAMSRELAMAPSQVFGQLDNVDLSFGTLSDGGGEEIELSHGNFNSFLINPEREVRRAAFFQYYQAYDNHKNTIAATLTGSIKKDLFYSRVRNFETCRANSLFNDNIPDSVYDSLVETVRGNLEPLFKYFDFRKDTLNISEPHFYDTYVPLVGDVDYKMTYEEAVEVCTKAVQPLGKAYAQTLYSGLTGGWVDRFENRGKRSGAYSSGCYDSPPYILLNYDENNINSLYTLIHEAGHSMHSYYSKKHQPFVDHDYTIFVAEVASTFNEDLLSRYLLDYYQDDPRMRAYILNREIDNIRATLFRQTMFAEFELITHALAEKNQPLTLDVFMDTYRELLGAYFGNTIALDEELSLECLRIPHFYSAFYVYKYATGVSAAIALADKVIIEGEPARDAYLDFLKLGGSKFPIDELLLAGVDMRSPEPVERAITHFGRLVDRLISEFGGL